MPTPVLANPIQNGIASGTIFWRRGEHIAPPRKPHLTQHRLGRGRNNARQSLIQFKGYAQSIALLWRGVRQSKLDFGGKCLGDDVAQT